MSHAADRQRSRLIIPGSYSRDAYQLYHYRGQHLDGPAATTTAEENRDGSSQIGCETEPTDLQHITTLN